MRDTLHEPTPEQKAAALEELKAVLRRPVPSVPQAELDILRNVALGDTGQSRSTRFLLASLVGAKDPAGFEGQGLLELRALDGKLAEAFLKILDWWRGPTKSDQPVYDVLAAIEERFPSHDSSESAQSWVARNPSQVGSRERA